MTANPMPPVPPMGSMSGVAPLATQSKFKPIDPMRLLRQHMVLLIAGAIIGGAVGAGAYIGLKKTAPQWTSTATLEASFKDATSPIGGYLRVDSTEIEQFIRSQMSVIKSDNILRSVLGNDRVQQTSWYQQLASKQIDIEKQADTFAQQLGVSPVRGSAMIQLSLGTASPNEAPEVLSTLINVYLNNFEQIANQLTGKDYSDQQAKKTQLSRLIEQLERDLEQTSRDSVPASLAETPQWQERSQLIQQEADTAAALRGVENSGQEEQTQETTTAPTTNDILLVENDQRVRAIDYEIDSIKRTLEANKARYGTRHTITQSTENELNAAIVQRTAVFDETMAKILDSQKSNSESAKLALAAQRTLILSRIEELNTELADIQAQIDQRRALADRISRYRENLTDVEADLQKLEIANNNSVLANKTVKELIPPQKAVMTSPRSVVVPLGAIVGFGLPFGLLMLRELLDQRVRGPHDLKAVPQAETLGVIPDSSEDPSGSQAFERAVQNAPTGLLAESFRQTRTALLGKMDRRGYKSLVVCGSQGGSGASAVAQNLAASIALNGRKVLIIDTNFRRPRQHELFGVANNSGLVGYLSGQTQDIHTVIQTLDQISLSVLPCGPVEHAAAELLDRPAFRQLLGELEAEYDMIVIDAAPALLTSEASLLIKCVDAVVAVVRAGSDHRGMVERLLNRLDGQRADLLGVVLNGVKASAGGYFKKNYEDFYRYNQGASRSGAKEAV